MLPRRMLLVAGSLLSAGLSGYGCSPERLDPAQETSSRNGAGVAATSSGRAIADGNDRSEHERRAPEPRESS
jgi:hypothetical protein